MGKVVTGRHAQVEPAASTARLRQDDHRAKGGDAKKKRNSVDIHPEVADLLDQLAHELGLKTRAEVLRKAVQLLALANKRRSTDGDLVVYLPSPDNKGLQLVHIL